MSFLKRINKKEKQRKKYSYISIEELENKKNRCIAIKEEINNLSKEIKFENVKKMSNLSKEYAELIKELQLYEKYSKEREKNENEGKR